MWLAKSPEQAFTERKKGKWRVEKGNSLRRPNNKYRAIIETLACLDPEPFFFLTSKRLSKHLNFLSLASVTSLGLFLLRLQVLFWSEGGDPTPSPSSPSTLFPLPITIAGSSSTKLSCAFPMPCSYLCK